MMKTWHPARFLRHTLMVMLLCTIVLMINILLGLISWKLFHSFWFTVYLFAFTPTWLACFGLVFATRWRWLELMGGVFLAIFFALFVYLRDMEGLGYRTALCITAGGIGMGTVSLGYAVRRLTRSLLQDLKKRPVPPPQDTPLNR
ncbi:MAG: hypothetical protein WCC10_04895 [Tumebacillaceae bacterium]